MSMTKSANFEYERVLPDGTTRSHTNSLAFAGAAA